MMLTISTLIDLTQVTYAIFHIFDKHASYKQKYLRVYESPFTTKALHREIMKRSRLRNNFLRTKSLEDKLKCNKQLNFVKYY